MNRIALGLFTALLCAAPAGEVRANEDEVRATLTAYVEAFNKQDLATVAAMWSEGATHVDRETGERSEGREAIQSELAAAFKDRPQARLSGSVSRVRMIKPDVASVEGQTSLTNNDEDPVDSVYSAILVKQGDKWLIDSIEESPLPQPESPTDALRELEWLVGNWTDEGDGAKVQTTIRWTPSNAFLLRSFSSESAEGDLQQGTQIIGWDPRARQIRSWTFNSDGSFGDAVWSKSDNDWLIKSSQTLSDGQAASGTYVLKQVDDNTITLELIGHEIEGEPQPARPAVKVVRNVEPKPAAANPAK